MGSPAASRSRSALDTPAGDLPLAVWPCANTSPQYQRAGRYLPASTAHPAKMAPELARRIVAEYSRPGELVADPLCGIGTTLVEATALGRRAVGVELEPRWAETARANLTHALPPHQAALAEVRLGDARVLPQVLADLAGTVDLVATSPPYACDVGMIDKPAWLAGRPLCRRDTLNYSTQRANLGHARGDRYLTELARVYAACFEVLRPGGLLVTVTKNLRRQGRVHDLATVTVQLATQAGFAYLQHVVALLAAVRDGDLHARPSFWQLTQTRKARARGEPAHLVVHEDVLVFGRPGGAHTAAPSRPPRGTGGAAALGARRGHTIASADTTARQRPARTGVRRVPGNYQHNPDPALAELLHTVTQEGWGNDRVGDVEEDGFVASLLLVDPAEQQELTDAFDQPVPAGNFIVHQDRQGVVTVDQYPTPFHARRAFTALAASTGPGEEDATIMPIGPLGAWYAVGLGGRFLGQARDLDQALGMLRAAMDADQVWPDIWFITDHGNPHRLDPDQP